MSRLKVVFLFLIVFGYGNLFSQAQQIDREPHNKSAVLTQSYEFYWKQSLTGLPFEQRVGLFLETPGTIFSGCVLYLQGLGDSIRNHSPLFHSLNRAGFRVVAFDYLGQGGSAGNMNWTRLDSKSFPVATTEKYEIGTQAKAVWTQVSQNPDPIYQRTCKGQIRRVIGWSTGGLAAYRLAHQGWAEQIVLLAPGIAPRLFVGEAADSWAGSLSSDIITMRTLTRMQFTPNADPHLDPIFPSSPLEVKAFAVNLLSTAKAARRWIVPSKVRGLVLLSGDEDSYVDAQRTRSVLKSNAPHFEVHSYVGALHELDNELPDVAADLRSRITSFFGGAITP